MTCLEAQSRIIAYIEDNLDKDKKIEFLKHVKNCNDCKEELDIYYTMLEGIHRMDNNLPVSLDYSLELTNKMERELKQNKKKREFFTCSVLVVILGVLGFSIAGYINFLRIVYEDEQQSIKDKQGQYYYSDTFDDYLFFFFKRMLNINVEPEIKEQPGFYKRIREYNVFNK